MKKRIIVLLSGGMDSVTVLYHSLKKHDAIGAISFDYDAKHNHREIPFAKLHCEKLNIPHQVVKLGFVGSLFTSSLLKNGEAIPDGHYEEEIMKKTVVPFRNGIMLSIACGYGESIGARGVVIAAHSGDHAIYPDCREQFMRAMGKAMVLGSYTGIELIRPFIKLNKSEIAKIGTALGLDYRETWSCYKGRQLHCGVCGTCVERREAFLSAGLEDPTEYENEIT